jgi:hypothetical protein
VAALAAVAEQGSSAVPGFAVAAGLAGALAWLALRRVLLLLLLLSCWLGLCCWFACCVMSFTPSGWRSANRVGLLWVHGRRVMENPSVGERGATLNFVSSWPLRSI